MKYHCVAVSGYAEDLNGAFADVNHGESGARDMMEDPNPKTPYLGLTGEVSHLMVFHIK